MGPAAVVGLAKWAPGARALAAALAAMASGAHVLGVAVVGPAAAALAALASAALSGTAVWEATAARVSGLRVCAPCNRCERAVLAAGVAVVTGRFTALTGYQTVAPATSMEQPTTGLFGRRWRR